MSCKRLKFASGKEKVMGILILFYIAIAFFSTLIAGGIISGLLHWFHFRHYPRSNRGLIYLHLIGTPVLWACCFFVIPILFPLDGSIGSTLDFMVAFVVGFTASPFVCGILALFLPDQ